METVHVFLSTGRFVSSDELRNYIDKSYTPDGDTVASPFMTEVDLDEYEPGCIEAITSATGQPVPVKELLVGASYAEYWLAAVDGDRRADAAIYVFPPNVVRNPAGCSLEHLGAFPYLRSKE